MLLQGSKWYNPNRQRLLDAVDLANLIGEQLPLKRAGREFKTICPFHDDSHPSLFINPQKGIFKCFVCGAGGNAVTWLERYFNVTRSEAWKLLAERTGIKVEFKPTGHRRPRSTAQPNQSSSSTSEQAFPDYVDVDPAEIIAAHQTALSFYRAILKHEKHGETARVIFADRGINDEMIERFELGAAPGGGKWDGLVQTLAAQEIDLKPFVASGLVSQRRSGDGFYDRFRNRLIFPIHDLLGRPVAFGARQIDRDDDPKYLNSPEHPRFSKSATLYGLHLAQREIQKQSTAIIVEGYTDVIACHMEGITNTVATLGTALTRQHASILQRYGSRVILLFDGDKAGQRAAERAVEIFFQTNVDIGIALLPDGQDPADLLGMEGGRHEFQRIVDRATEALDFLLATFKRQLEEGQRGISGRQQLIEEFLSRLGFLGFHQMLPMRRDLVIPRLAEMLGVGQQTILGSIPKPHRRSTKEVDAGVHGGNAVRSDQTNPADVSTPAGRLLSERGLLGCLLVRPRLLLADDDGTGQSVRDRLRSTLWSSPLHHGLSQRLIEFGEAFDDDGEEAEVPTSLPDFDDDTINRLVNDLYWELERQTDEGDPNLVTYKIKEFCKSLSEFEDARRVGDRGIEIGTVDPDAGVEVIKDQLTESIQRWKDLQAGGGRRRMGFSVPPRSASENRGSREIDEDGTENAPRAGQPERITAGLAEEMPIAIQRPDPQTESEDR